MIVFNTKYFSLYPTFWLNTAENNDIFFSKDMDSPIPTGSARGTQTIKGNHKSEHCIGWKVLSESI